MNIFTMAALFLSMQFLEEHGIGVMAFECVANILTQDESDICPGELMAIHIKDTDEFVKKIKEILNISAVEATGSLIVPPDLD